MKRIRTNLLIGLLFAATAHDAVSASIDYIGQREGSKLVDIYYDADNDDGSSIFVSVSISDGSSPISSPTLSGDIGNVSASSGLQVVWDGGTDLDGIITSNLTINLTVSESVPDGMTFIPAGSIDVDDPDFNGYSVSSPDLFMDTYEVDAELWQSVYSWAIVNQYQFQNAGTWKDEGHPVVSINSWDCILWCNARSQMEGRSPCYRNAVNEQLILKQWISGVQVSCIDSDGYRLPTAEQWEYAARGGESDLRYPWGDTLDRTNANCRIFGHLHPDYESGSSPYTAPVGDFEPNGFGLYNMAGNVSEICWDADGDYHARKGGSWDDGTDEARCGNSETIHETGYQNSTGFRTVCGASADSLSETIVFDSRDYSLEVTSAHGSPEPSVGITPYAWMSAVTCSVDSVVDESGTNYACIGWAGTGSVPVSGSSNLVVVVLDDLASSIVWNWASDDTDSDGMDDDWELKYFDDLDQAATNDFDFDGQDNLSEYIAGTIPTNKASLFKLTTSAIAEGFVLEWPTASNRVYNIYWTPNLQHTTFGSFETNIAYPRHSATSTVDRGFFKMDVRK